MRFLLTASCILGMSIGFCVAADIDLRTADNKSPLLGDGPLQAIHAPLSKIFQFAVDGDQLKINRAAWDRAAKEIADNPQPNNNAANPFGGGAPAPAFGGFGNARVAVLNRANFGGAGPASPMEALFQQIQRQAQVGSRSMSSGSGGSNTTRTNSFSSDSLSGELSITGDAVRLSLTESALPKRALQFSTEPDAGFRMELTHPDGDMILLSENRQGRFTVVAIVGGKVFSDQADSFLAFYKHNRQRLDADIFPALSPLGICPILSPDSPEVQQAVLAVLLRTPELTAEGNKLLDQLDSDSIDDRESATKDLTERFSQFSDLVDQRINDKATAPEARNRLQGIAQSQTDSQQARQTIALLNLLNDPKFIISLLDEVAPHENVKLIKRLEQLTGEKLGTEPTDWKRWAQKNLK